MSEDPWFQEEAERALLKHLNDMAGAWSLQSDGADICAISASGRALSFVIVGSRDRTWKVRRDSVVGVDPVVPDRWWAFVILPGGDKRPAVFLVPDSGAKQAAIRRIARDWFSRDERDPKSIRTGWIDVDLGDLARFAGTLENLPK